MMKPKQTKDNETGLLEYLEDIIGSDKYIESIDLAYEELEKQNDLRNNKLNRVKLVEKEKNNLIHDKNEAEEYLNLNQKLSYKQASLYQKHISTINKSYNKQVIKQDKIQQLLTEKDIETKSLQLIDLQQVKEAKDIELKKYIKEKDKLNEIFNSYDTKDIKYNEDILHLNKQIKDNQQNMNLLHQKVDNLNKDEISKNKLLNKYQEKIKISHEHEKKS